MLIYIGVLGKSLKVTNICIYRGVSGKSLIPIYRRCKKSLLFIYKGMSRQSIVLT